MNRSCHTSLYLGEDGACPVSHVPRHLCQVFAISGLKRLAGGIAVFPEEKHIFEHRDQFSEPALLHPLRQLDGVAAEFLGSGVESVVGAPDETTIGFG